MEANHNPRGNIPVDYPRYSGQSYDNHNPCSLTPSINKAMWHDCCTSTVVDVKHWMGDLIYIYILFNLNTLRLPSKKTNINHSYHQTRATLIFPGGYCTKNTVTIFRMDPQPWVAHVGKSYPPSLAFWHLHIPSFPPFNRVTVFSMGDSDLFRACRSKERKLLHKPFAELREVVHQEHDITKSNHFRMISCRNHVLVPES